MSDDTHVLDLFAGLGGFSAAFEDAAGYTVTTVDSKDRFDPDICADVLDLRPDDLPEADVILASPPCTTFSVAGNHTDHYVDGDPNSETAKTHITLAYHALGLIRALAPEWWVVENPRGRLRRFFGAPDHEITLCQYGYDWQKPTDLWGDLPPSFDARRCAPGADCHAAGPSGFDSDDETAHVRDPAERAKLPSELSACLLDAVEHPEPAQRTLAEAHP